MVVVECMEVYPQEQRPRKAKLEVKKLQGKECLLIGLKKKSFSTIHAHIMECIRPEGKAVELSAFFSMKQVVLAITQQAGSGFR